MREVEVRHTCFDDQLVEFNVFEVTLDDHEGDELGDVVLEVIPVSELVRYLRVDPLELEDG